MQIYFQELFFAGNANLQSVLKRFSGLICHGNYSAIFALKSWMSFLQAKSICEHFAQAFLREKK